MRLPRSHSLTSADLGNFFKLRNKRLNFSCFYAYYRDNTAGILRLSVSLGKKKFAKATQRSKIKRLLYKAVVSVPDLTGYSFDVVIVPLPGIEKVPDDQLSREIRELFADLK